MCTTSPVVGVAIILVIFISLLPTIISLLGIDSSTWNWNLIVGSLVVTLLVIWGLFIWVSNRKDRKKDVK